MRITELDRLAHPVARKFVIEMLGPQIAIGQIKGHGWLQLHAQRIEYMTSDHRIAGPSHAGCKLSTRANLQAILILKNKAILASD